MATIFSSVLLFAFFIVAYGKSNFRDYSYSTSLVSLAQDYAPNYPMDLHKRHEGVSSNFKNVQLGAREPKLYEISLSITTSTLSVPLASSITFLEIGNEKHSYSYSISLPV